MNWNDVLEAVKEAKNVVSDGDFIIRKTAGLMVGRLKIAAVDSDVLKDLKRELKDFNIQTGRWMK